MTGAVKAFCLREGFPLAGRHILCAVSGGIDSMSLLHLLWQWREQGALTLTAATFDHRLRASSGEDAAFVEGWCRAHHIPCLTGAGDVAAYAESAGETVEQAGRTLRYRFLQRSAETAGADWIATAHNADDNAETLLLHLLRGTGLQGLGGIPPRRGNIIRPLLAVSREEIAAYARRNAVPFREDESNADTAYTRNFLRHRVLPLLRQQNPNLTATLSRTAESLRRDEACLAALADEAEKGGEMTAQGLRGLPEAVALRLVQRLAQRASPGTVLPWSQREAVLRLARSSAPSGQVSLAGGLEAVRSYDALTIAPKGQAQSFAPFLLRDGEERFVPELGAVFHCRRGETFSAQHPGRVYLRGGGGALLLRPRQTGDCIRLKNRGSKSLKKWMIEAKVPRDRRGLVPVIEIERSVAALWEMGRDEAWLPVAGQPYWEIWTERKENPL